MTEKAPALQNSIRDVLAPELRKDGFRGSGKTYYRIVNDFIQILNIQSSRWSGRFAINLGLHPLCIPMNDGKAPEIKKIKEYECVFRRRLREDNLDTWFEYTENQASMDNAVENALELYLKTGRELFAEVALPTSNIHTITAKSFEEENYNFAGFGNTQLLTAWSLARMRKHVGNYEGALNFANIAINIIGNGIGGRGILPEIEEFISELN